MVSAQWILVITFAFLINPSPGEMDSSEFFQENLQMKFNLCHLEYIRTWYD